MNNGYILLSSELEEILKTELVECKTEVNIVSAFCKVSTLKLLDSHIEKGIRKRLLVRFLPSDIAIGATDKEIYYYCIQNGWDIFIDNTLHAKTYIFDHIKCIIGSANTTNKGIGFSKLSNKEASAFFELNKEDYNKILSLYQDSLVLNDEIYNEIIKSKDDTIILHLSKFKLKDKKIECLMSEDFPNAITDTIELYCLKSYKWLVAFLKTKTNNTSYFGELSAELHNIFVKDPRPYRKNIKQHLTDLLECIKRLEISNIKITRPNHSEIVQLII